MGSIIAFTLSTRKLILGLFFLALLIFLGANTHRDIPLEKLKERYANEASQFIEINGMPVHYRDEGQGMPIVLVHGTGASLHTWDAWTAELQKSYRVIRMDIPAFGLTGPHPTHNYSVEAYADFLDSFVEKIGVDSFHLGGNSLGGYISWFYATQYPGKVAYLVLLDPSGYPNEGSTPAIFKMAKTPIINGIVRFLTPKFLIKKNLKEVYFDDQKVSKELVKRYHQMALRKGNRTAFIERAKTPFVDHSDLLQEIKSPTIIIWGQQDYWIPIDLANEYLARIPSARLISLDKMGHVPMEEDPARSLRYVEAFLKPSAAQISD